MQTQREMRAVKIAEQIRKECKLKPEIGIILGSGWGDVCDNMEDRCSVPYAELDGMPACGVKGHAGNFLLGRIGGKNVLAVQGRFHLYEGKPMEDVVLPVQIAHALGVQTLILTNSAGALNPDYNVGDLMIFHDHINLTGRNPLAGLKPTEANPVFVDMTHVYDKSISDLLKGVCLQTEISFHEGIYLQVLGPSYETPAEVRAFYRLGADAVGMSTVVEAIFARYLKMRVAAISCITNKGAGLSENELNHAEVLAALEKNRSQLSDVLFRFIEKI